MWEIWNYDIYACSDVGVWDGADLKVMENFQPSVVKGLNVIRNNDVDARSDVGVWYIDDLEGSGKLP